MHPVKEIKAIWIKDVARTLKGGGALWKLIIMMAKESEWALLHTSHIGVNVEVKNGLNMHI